MIHIHKGFTKDDVRAVIIKCKTLPHYSILFACYEKEQVDYYLEFVKSLNIEDVRIFKSKECFRIIFINGSIIFFTTVGTTRGLRVQEAYYDFLFDEETVYTIIMPQIRPDY